MEDFPSLESCSMIEVILNQIAEYWTDLNQGSSSHEELSLLFSDVMQNCRKCHRQGESVLRLLEELFCLLFYVRDISHGLGLRQTFYMMMMHFYDAFPMLGVSVYPILLDYYDPLPYGCWRDVVGLCDYLKHNSSRREEHPLVYSVLEYMNRRLKDECVYFAHHGECDTNLVKWIPREKSRNGWIFSILANDWFRDGRRDSKRVYRKLVSRMRESMNIVEVHMCSGSWEKIRADKLSHGSYSKYWYALCDQSRDFSYKHSSHDRILCARNINRNLNTPVYGMGCRETISNLPFVFPSCIGRFVSYAFNCIREKGGEMGIYSSISEEIFRLNRAWERMVTGWKRKYGKHDYFPVVRITESMHSKNTCYTIGMALLLYETGRSDIYYDGHAPDWIRLVRGQSFLSHIETIYHKIVDSIFPSTRTHSVSCSGSTPVILVNGKYMLEDSSSFVGQTQPNVYTHAFDIMGVVLFHKRYDFVRRKFHIIAQQS